MTLKVIITILILYLAISFAIYGLLIRIKSFIIVTLVSIGYFLGTYFYFELINTIDHKLAERKINLEFGHANIILLELFLICLIIAIVNIVLIFVKRKKIASH
jgi:hypothetical protein